jgi:hypothetical protein
MRSASSLLRVLLPLPAACLLQLQACSPSSSGSSTASDSGAEATVSGADASDTDASREVDATSADDASTGADTSPTADGNGLESGSPASDSAAPGDDGASDAAPPVDAGGSDASSGPDASNGTDASGAIDASDLCAALQGSFQATAVSCNGTPINIASVTWLANISGSSASFSEAIAGGCALISSGTISCNAGEFNLLWSNPNTCNPTNCTFWGAQCSATPNERLAWLASNVTSTSFVATSENEPDGGPTPLTTCTSQGLSNPIQITWTRQ